MVKSEQAFSEKLCHNGTPAVSLWPTMDDLIKLVRTYRLTTGLADRLALSEQVFKLIVPDLKFFIFRRVAPDMADDVLQEVLHAIAVSLNKFEGRSNGEFWSWCYGIARNKLKDHYQSQTDERVQTFAPDELWQIMDDAERTAPMSSGDRLDLEYALKLLGASKPECRELLWRHYVKGHDYGEIAEEEGIKYDAARMKIGRCLSLAQSLVS
jgi:RNA polymerase sigma factor (sigma-70 family)